MMERRFRGIHLETVPLDKLLTTGSTWTCIKGLPEGAVYLFNEKDCQGRTILVFYHPSFEVVLPGAVIRVTEAMFS